MKEQDRQLLKHVQHRTAPCPDGPWLAYQEWHQVLFFHWPVDPHWLHPILPQPLRADVFEGQAWISAVAFRVQKLYPRYASFLGPLFHFTELNLRTYVLYRGTNGILFLNVKTNSPVWARLLRTATRLPYLPAGLRFKKDELLHYHCHASGGDLELDASFLPGTALEPKTALDRWLTERYDSYYVSGNQLLCLPVHHPEWPLQHCSFRHINCRIPLQDKIFGTPALTHYAARLPVLAWGQRSANRRWQQHR